jgi:hypothetical protein
VDERGAESPPVSQRDDNVVVEIMEGRRCETQCHKGHDKEEDLVHGV